ncbi:MAG TPA: preprotein translocase subunit SecG [Stellaceae bacterium]|jgi:preprotein translocase subunit SecG
MINVLLVVHVLIAISLVGVVLVQKSEGGGLGMGGGGMSGFMTGRSTANLLTRTTAILAGCFMLTSIVLVVLAGNHGAPRSIIDQTSPTAPSPAVPSSLPPAPAQNQGAPNPVAPAEPAPAPAPAEPSVPTR